MRSPRDKFQKKVRRLDAYRRKNEKLFLSGSIVDRDLDIVYEGIFLSAYVSFENFIEDQFINFLLGASPQLNSKPTPRALFSDRRVARRILYGRHSYVDWLPYDNTKKMAKAFFRRNNPFESLQNQEIRHINRLHFVRNYIAHESVASKNRFEAEVNIATLRPSQRRPAGYLRSSFSAQQTTYESEVGHLIRIAALLD